MRIQSRLLTAAAAIGAGLLLASCGQKDDSTAPRAASGPSWGVKEGSLKVPSILFKANSFASIVLIGVVKWIKLVASISFQ